MPAAKERHIPDHFLLFADKNFSLSVRRHINAGSTEGWLFFDGQNNVGTLIAVRDHHNYWNVTVSFTIEPDADQLNDYLVAFLDSLGIDEAFVTGYTGGSDSISFDFK